MVRIVNSQTEEAEGGVMEESIGFARFRGNTNQGRLQVNFNRSVPFWGAFDVLETDYDNYAVIFSRFLDIFGHKREFVWVITRQPYAESDPRMKKIKERAVEILEADVPGFKFDDKMRFTKQNENIKNFKEPEKINMNENVRDFSNLFGLL